MGSLKDWYDEHKPMTDKEIRELKEQERKLFVEKEAIEEKIEDIRFRFGDAYNSPAEVYENFFLENKYNYSQVRLHRLPSIEKFKIYREYSGNQRHPLDKNGGWGKFSTSYFNPEELAVLIKLIYQFETGKEYNILTFGNTVNGANFSIWAYPRLHFLVCDKDKTEKFKMYHGNYYETLNKFDFSKPQQGVIAVSQTAFLASYNPLYGEPDKEEYNRTMVYDEYINAQKRATAYFRKYENIFRQVSIDDLDNIKSHRDLFTFSIAQKDNFISDILYNIMIYKYQNRIKYLKDQDYAKIINDLYKQEIIPVSKQVNIEIPKRLKYVKDPESKAKFL